MGCFGILLQTGGCTFSTPGRGLRLTKVAHVHVLILLCFALSENVSLQQSKSCLDLQKCSAPLITAGFADMLSSRLGNRYSIFEGCSHKQHRNICPEGVAAVMAALSPSESPPSFLQVSLA